MSRTEHHAGRHRNHPALCFCDTHGQVVRSDKLVCYNEQALGIKSLLQGIRIRTAYLAYHGQAKVRTLNSTDYGLTGCYLLRSPEVWHKPRRRLTVIRHHTQTLCWTPRSFIRIVLARISASISEYHFTTGGFLGTPLSSSLFQSQEVDLGMTYGRKVSYCNTVWYHSGSFIAVQC